MAWIFTTDGNYVNFNGGGNLWRLHKDSNCISWHWDESGDLFFDVYDSEFTVKAENIANVVIDGVPLSAASGFPTAIRAVFTGLGGGASYLSYVALLSQQETGAPTVDILENTIGNIVWTRQSTGVYIGTLTGAFAYNKTFIIAGDYSKDSKTDALWNDDDSVMIKTSFYSSSVFNYIDTVLSLTPIEIRVYP